MDATSHCEAVEWVEHDFDAGRPWYEAQIGDHVWDWKMGEGHVIAKIASCGEDERYCADWGWTPHQHEDVPMCECGRLSHADHHWTLMARASDPPVILEAE